MSQVEGGVEIEGIEEWRDDCSSWVVIDYDI
jgi:hypothetical protein